MIDFPQRKRDLIEAVRKTNPASVNTAPVIFWDVEGSLRTVSISSVFRAFESSHNFHMPVMQSTIDDSDVKQQMTIVENGVNYNIKRYNDLKVLNARLTKELKARLDDLEYQKKSFESLDAMKKAQTEEGMRIESLQHEIRDVEAEIRDRVHYSRKLDHMLNRLKKNQVIARNIGISLERIFDYCFCVPLPFLCS